MTNYADDWTEGQIKKLEKKITKEYDQAYKELVEQYKSFVPKNKDKIKKLQEQYNGGSITKEEYQNKMASSQFVSGKWLKLLDQFADDLTLVDQKAASITKSFLPSAYALNHNYENYELEQGLGIKTSFTLYNRHTVERLLQGKRDLLPKPYVDIPKDKRWNKAHLTSALTQSVLQGDDLKTTAQRFRQVTDMDQRASIRNARTAMTGAQNRGKLDALERQKAMGIDVKKKWIATLDNHTRDTHAKLDGEIVALNKSFSNKLRYPGDPNGEPAEVYNCRCSLTASYPEYPPKDLERYDNEAKKAIKGMTYEQWEQMKIKEQKAGTAVKDLEDAQEELKKLTNTYSQDEIGKTFSGIWQEDVTYADYEAKKDSISAKYDYYQGRLKEIEDVIGKPDFSQCGGEELAQILNKVNATTWRVDSTDSIFWYEFTEEEREKIKALAKNSGLTTRGVLNAYKDLISQNGGVKYSMWLKFTRLEKELTEFETNGAKYSKYFAQIEDLKQKIKALKIEAKAGMPKSAQFAPDAWDELVKSRARFFSNRTDADKYFREYLDEIWDDLDDQGKYALWQYTAGSGGLNRPLSGYNGSWRRSSFVGWGKSDWKYENTSDSPVGRSADFYKFTKDGVKYDEAIVGLTKLIDQSSLPDNVWVVRGSSSEGFAGLLEGDIFSWEDAQELLKKDSKTLKDALVGQTVQNHSFLSTAIAKGSGFGGNVHYEIYAPAGTHAIYAEPQSAYGNTADYGEMYYAGKSYYGVGSEAEVVFQRGTTFRITDVESDGWGSIKVKMEVVEQPDYFEYGDEDTYNNGATRHKH